MRRIAAHFERDSGPGSDVGIVPGVPAARAQGQAIDEFQSRPKEVLELCLSETEEEIPKVLGVQDQSVARHGSSSRN